MTESEPIPYIPETAPFTSEQRAYLNGFIAGLFSRVPVSVEGCAPQAATKQAKPLAVLYGSQTGTAEGLARRVCKAAAQKGFAPVVYEMAHYPREQLSRAKNLALLTSTYGDGEPPDNAKAFWDYLNDAHAPKLSGVQFSVLALGDSNYPKFCECGKQFDLRLEQLGATRVRQRVDCDVDYEEGFRQWLESVLAAMDSASAGGTASGELLKPVIEEVSLGAATSQSSAQRAGVANRYDREHPFPAALVANIRLTGPGSAKETRHFEIAVDSSEIEYEPGDALGILPSNCPELVEQILGAIGASGDEPVPGPSGAEVSVRDALLSNYDITKVSRPFLEALAVRSRDQTLEKLLRPDANGEVAKFLWGRDMLDLLTAYSNAKFSALELVNLLKKLQPRLYSISSSPKANPGQVHLSVGVVRYEAFGRRRKGVCSTFLADRRSPQDPLRGFVHTSRHFRLPPDGDRPLIMVGPGTGIAPFRAFLQERRAVGAKGKTWLFFGDQRAASDFLYRDELEAMRREGTLTRMDTAFSRDQQEKIYVQHRLVERAKDVYAWLQDGAHFYVCGDANRMAKDVDAALHQVIEIAGGCAAQQAAEYVCELKKQHRYERDVY